MNENQVTNAESSVLIISSLAIAVLYTLCFTGREVLPKLSFFIFCSVSTGAMYIIFNRLNYLSNKKAFLWAVPIVIISAFNAIFQLSFFTYTNVIMAHILFAVMGFSAAKGEMMPISKASGWIDILRICCGNLFASFDVYKSLFGGRRRNTIYIAVRILLGIVISLPVIGIIMIFLADADAVFKSIIINFFDVFKEKNINALWHFLCIVLVALYLPGYIYNLKHMKEEAFEIPAINLDVIVGTTFLALINLMFLFFCVVQMAFLFTGGYMSLPEGIVYSAYAREGFFQLLFVTIINFGVITILLKIFPACIRLNPIKILLLMLCAFTGVLIFSSFYRMNLYISAYGHTDLRMMVITFLAMEVVCVFITVAYLLKPDRDFFKQYLYVGLVFYMIVNITASQYFVTTLNINRYYKGADLDVRQFSRQQDTHYLLLEVLNSEDFQKRTDDEFKNHANEIIMNFQNQDYYGDDHWQNWSLLQHISQLHRN